MTLKADFSCCIIGAGPAGLIAAERLSEAGCRVAIYDRMPTPGRKFLMAGRGGLNLTHSEDMPDFVSRYGAASGWMAPLIQSFSPDELQNWSALLGEPVFTGSSGRVFPKSFKASPLLRAWLARLRSNGVTFYMNHDWQGFNDKGALHFTQSMGKSVFIKSDAVLLALGGASWPKLGSNASWVSILNSINVDIVPLRSSNVGGLIKWSDHFISRFAGVPLKRLIVRCGSVQSHGEATITKGGIEGGAIYALGPELRRVLEQQNDVEIFLDLRRDLTIEQIMSRLAQKRGKKSLSSYLSRTIGLDPLSIALLRESALQHQKPLSDEPESLARAIKSCSLIVSGLGGLDRAISTAGGIKRTEIDERMMLKKKPGIFTAGEMIDWDAPTGGYLLQACFSSGITAARGMLDWLNERR